ncbi:HTH-type transcriptional regulator BetI [Trichinella spiralis]|uniref:HTH-type transcriptional regulator BetI n=1 Tax=Trichinella spiralis TaxID=6334 RepID=UPI0001EFED1C|nr:HTH-type transcriptional regulator BetI [Trichinella spiralis]
MYWNQDRRLLDFAVSSRQCRLASATTSNDRNLRPFLPLLYVSRILKFPIQHAYVSLHNLQEACFDDLLRQLLCDLLARNGSIIRNAPASSGNGSLDLSKSAFQSLSLPLQVLPQIPIGERPIARRESMSLANVSEVPNEKRFLSRGVPFPPSSLSKSTARVI